jgi:hypothetical protein
MRWQLPARTTILRGMDTVPLPGDSAPDARAETEATRVFIRLAATRACGSCPATAATCAYHVILDTGRDDTAADVLVARMAGFAAPRRSPGEGAYGSRIAARTVTQHRLPAAFAWFEARRPVVKVRRGPGRCYQD